MIAGGNLWRLYVFMSRFYQFLAVYLAEPPGPHLGTGFACFPRVSSLTLYCALLDDERPGAKTDVAYYE